jgi:hypothetical protein
VGEGDLEEGERGRGRKEGWEDERGKRVAEGALDESERGKGRKGRTSEREEGGTRKGAEGGRRRKLASASFSAVPLLASMVL